VTYQEPADSRQAVARRALCPLLAILAVLGTGCGGTLVWQGKTPDRRALVQVREDRKGQWVRMGDWRGPHSDGIGLDALVVQGKHIAYPARRGKDWVVELDGRPSDRWDGIGELAFSPDGARLAFSAERASQWQVVVDGKAGPPVESIFARSLTWSADGRSLAYAANRDGWVHAVLDQVLGPAWNGVGRLAFAGSRLLYVGRNGPTSCLVVDGVAGEPEDWIGDIAISPDGVHIAHVAGLGGEEHLILDGSGVAGPARGHISLLQVDAQARLTFVSSSSREARVVRHFEAGPVYQAIPELVVTPAGRWAYLARDAQSMRAVVDGVPQDPCEWASNLVASPDGRAFAYLARRQGRTMVIRESTAQIVDAVVDGSLVWSRDSRHWACLAGDPRTQDIFVSIDGLRRRPFDLRELVFLAERPATLDGNEKRQLQQIVAGELELE
jgi:hypothetical protein